ncbi:MAG: ABC transporter substrate-binding protein [Firmicutes bacterium]|nr:ABC transporter substrate-binding protein [Bacillota bacterium]
MVKVNRQQTRALLALVLIVALTAFAAGACKKQEAKGGAKLEKIIVGYASTPDLGMTPSLLAWDEIREMGYEVVPKFLTANELVGEALNRGDIDVGMSGGVQLYAANAQGADFKAFFLVQGNKFTMIGRGDVKTFKDMHGKKFGLHSAGSITKSMSDLTLAQKAPDVKPQVLFIPGSENRAEAMLRGELDATVLELEDILHINSKQPGNFNVISSFATDLSDFLASPFFAKSKFLTERKPAAKAIVKSVLNTYRRIAADPQWMVERAPKYVPAYNTELLPEAVGLYVKYNLWPINGGLDLKAQQFTIDFYAQQNQIPKDSKPEKFFDRSILDEVLKEIGTK